MGFDLKRAATGYATGGLSELWRGIQPNSVTQDQIPLETPEQRAARKKLMQFADTGQFGNFTAGEAVPLGYGDYNVTDIEQSGLSELQKLLLSGVPEQFTQGDEALKSILNPDPNYIQSQFTPFQSQVQRMIRDSTSEAKRNSAYLGNLYSTNAIRNIGDVQARGNETLTSELARLTDQTLSRRAAAIPLAYQAGQAREGINLGRINASQVYGGLTRQLNDAAIKARDAELLRRRQELQLPIQAASNVAGSNANFGVPSVTTQTPSTLMDLLQLIVKGGATYYGAKAGAA